MGALIVHAPSTMLGTEPEVIALSTGARVHSSVREHAVEGDVTYAALYPRLAAGIYRIDGTDQVARVVSGHVAEIYWLADGNQSRPSES